MISVESAFRDWVPIRFYWRDSEPFVDWCYMAEERFTQPFFRDTIQLRMREPFNVTFRHQTPVEFLEEVITAADVIAPTGFIFHMSRCGSTLVAQMLAAAQCNIVMSEPPVVDSVIMAESSGLREENDGEWLKWMIGVLGRRRFAEERNYFIKFDSWNTLDLALIQKLFPDVPWAFLYRNPIEVIVSQIRRRGSQMIPGAMQRLIPDMTIDEALRIRAEEYCARVLATFCDVALQHCDSNRAILLNYDQLPGAVLTDITEHFKLSFSPADLEQIQSAAKRNAKTPRESFLPDSEQKRNEASDAIREAARRWVDPLYEALEEKRLAQVR